MRAEALLEVIHAAFHNRSIEVHRDGQWCRWTGPMIALVEEMQRGVLFRVKREPRSVWAIERIDNRLSECDPDKEYLEDRRSPGERVVEFREVL